MRVEVDEKNDKDHLAASSCSLNKNKILKLKQAVFKTSTPSSKSAEEMRRSSLTETNKSQVELGTGKKLKSVQEECESFPKEPVEHIVEKKNLC